MPYHTFYAMQDQLSTAIGTSFGKLLCPNVSMVSGTPALSKSFFLAQERGSKCAIWDYQVGVLHKL